MPTHPPIPPSPEPQGPLDLGDLTQYRAGEYIKVGGRWFVISDLRFEARVVVNETLAGRLDHISDRIESIELTLQVAPWKKDD